MRRYTVVCGDDLAREIESLAKEYDLTDEDVIRQLLAAGLDEVKTIEGEYSQ